MDELYYWPVGIEGYIYIKYNFKNTTNKYEVVFFQPSSGDVSHGAYKFLSTAKRKAIELAKEPY